MTTIGSAYVDIRAITSKLERDIRETLSRIQDTVTIKVDADVSAATAKIEALQQTIADSVSDVDVDVNVDADTGEARAEIDAVEEHARRARPSLLVRANTILARAQLAILSRARTATIFVKTNEASIKRVGTILGSLSGGRVLADYLEDIGDKLKNLDKAVPGIAKISLMFGSLASLILSSVGGLLTFGAALGSIINMGLIALPGMVTGFAVGIGLMVTALTDFKKQLPDVVEQYKTLGQVIKTNFWDEARESVRDMAFTLFPSLRDGIAETSVSLGKWTANLATSVKEGLTADILKRMFDNLKSSIDIASNATRDNVNSLITLGDVGGALLPRLAGWWVDVSDKFNNFITKAAADGSLNRWVEDGIRNLKLLSSTIGDAFGIFGNLTEAARLAGSDGLQTVANTLDKIRQATEGQEFLTNMAAIFRGANSAASSLGDGLSSIVTAIGSAAPAIETILGSVGNSVKILAGSIAGIISTTDFQSGMVSMFDGIQKGIQALAPSLELIGPKLGELGRLVGALAENIGGVLGKAIELLIPPFIEVGKVLEPIVRILGGFLIEALGKLQPVFAKLGEVVQQIGPPLQELVTKLADFLMPVIEALVPVLEVVVEQIGNSLKFILTAATNVVDLLSALFKGDLSGAFEACKAQISAALNFLADTFDTIFGGDIRSALADFGKGWNDFWGGFGSMMSDIVNNISKTWNDFWGGLGGMVSDIWNSVTSAIDTGLKGVEGFFNDTVTNVTNLWNGMWNGIRDFFQPIIDGISQAIGIFVQAWTIYWTTVSDIFKNIWNGIVAFFTPIVELFSAIISGVIGLVVTIWQAGWEIVSAVFQGIWTNLVAFFTPIIQFISDTITNTVNTVMSVWNSTWQIISDFFVGVWNGLVAFVTPIVQFISDTISTAVNFISSTWNTVWSSISSFFVSIWNGIVAFVTPIIQTISNTITSVMNTISSIWNSVWGSIRNFVVDIWSTIYNWVASKISQVQSIISSVVSTVSAIWNSTWSSISSFFTGIWNTIVSGVQNLANGISNGINNAISFVTSLPGKILSAVGNFGSLLVQSGRDLINGLTSGINDMFGNLMGKVKEIGSTVANSVKSFFGIASPSKMFRYEIGQQLGKGLVLGLNDSLKSVSAAADLLGAAAVPIIEPFEGFSGGASSASGNLISSATIRGGSPSNSSPFAGTAGAGNVNFNVYPSQGLNETQIGEAAMNHMYWKITADTTP